MLLTLFVNYGSFPIKPEIFFEAYTECVVVLDSFSLAELSFGSDEEAFVISCTVRAR